MHSFFLKATQFLHGLMQSYAGQRREWVGEDPEM